MMTRILAAALVWLGLGLSTFAQPFPQFMPPNTVYGRSGISTGPGQAIPFSVIVQTLNNTANIWSALQSFNGGIGGTISSGALTPGFLLNMQPGGSVSSIINGAIDYFNGTIITNWNVRDAGTGTAIFAADGVQLFVNGSSAYSPNGTFAFAVDTQTFQIAPSSIGSSNNYGGIISRGIVQTTIPAGVTGYGLTGINANMVISPGVSNVAQITGIETDMSSIGLAPLSRIGYLTALGPTDATQGSINDASFYWTLAAASVSPGWHNIFLLNPPSGTKLLDTGGCIFCVAGAVQTIATGFDFHTWTVSGFAFRSPNFFVNGAGNASVASLLVNTTTITAGVNAQIHAATDANLIFVNNGGTIQGEAINDAINSLRPFMLTASNWSIDASGNGTFSLIKPTTIYSAAGTPLPACAAGTDGNSAVVSDATSATYAGTYTSGGAQKRRVLCVNGTGWITN